MTEPGTTTPLPQHLLRTGLIVLSVNFVIALLLTLFVRDLLWHNLVYANAIGLCIWAFIEIGKRIFIRDDTRSALRWTVLTLVSVLAAYLVGSRIASEITGHSLLSYWLFETRRASGMLLVSLVAGGTVTYYFVSRTRLAQSRAQAEAAQRQAAESTLRLLESQLEPHMLFNTLANLRALITTDPPRAIAMLDRLIAYLRATLAASRATSHTLQAEFERLRDYLELMAVRLGPRLRYTLELPPELATQPVPALLLQPLVENGILHGLEPKVEGGSLHVSVRREGALLTLVVSDSGMGYTAATPAGSGFGLAQVRERLLSTYGAQAALDLATPPGGGTIVTLSFPAA
ncbi:sensor histidine kinase [Rhodoferax sp. BAB1]|uniref:sensor histidine kinase n=1 Tax=Rhodoferax sp. BAB1 TaxID=2741720 RepID=UPI00157735F3|nr:histidine kinase [Rhodoferax sp. BAB1]QKO22403.1 histidine kinase [Rhodoferax sp. BAB1]